MRNKAKITYDKIIGIFFLVPTVGLLIFTSLYPLIRALMLSFFDYNLSISKEMTFIGFQNYIYAFKDENFLYSLFITIVFVITTVTFELIIGFFIALLLAREGKRLRIVRSLVLIPMVIAPVVVGLLWRTLFSSDFGLINYLLSLINISKQIWLANPNLALIAVMITDIWEWTPFVIICFVAGLTSLPATTFEAATVDGANRIQILKYVIIPLMKPVIMVTLLLRTIDAFKVFDTIYVMTFGGPGNRTKLVSWFIYEKGLKYFQIGYASAISWVLIIGVFLLTFYFLRQRQKME